MKGGIGLGFDDLGLRTVRDERCQWSEEHSNYALIRRQTWLVCIPRACMYSAGSSRMPRVRPGVRRAGLAKAEPGAEAGPAPT